MDTGHVMKDHVRDMVTMVATEVVVAMTVTMDVRVRIIIMVVATTVTQVAALRQMRIADQQTGPGLMKEYVPRIIVKMI